MAKDDVDELRDSIEQHKQMEEMRHTSVRRKMSTFHRDPPEVNTQLAARVKLKLANYRDLVESPLYPQMKEAAGVVLQGFGSPVRPRTADERIAYETWCIARDAYDQLFLFIEMASQNVQLPTTELEHEEINL